LTFVFIFEKIKKEKKYMKKELNSDAFIWALISALHIQIKPLVKEKPKCVLSCSYGSSMLGKPGSIRRKVRKKSKYQRSLIKGSLLPSRDDLLPNFSLTIRVNILCTKH